MELLVPQNFTSSSPRHHYQALDTLYMIENTIESWFAGFLAGERVAGDLETWLQAIPQVRLEIRYHRQVLSEMIGEDPIPEFD